MNITPGTKISDLIRFNSESVNAIASLDKSLEKLRNPILRKVLASRVTIKDASRISGVSVERFFDALRPLGFTINSMAEGESEKNYATTQNMNLENIKPVLTLDVRPILQSNKDPFHSIMESVKELKQGETLELLNSFEPTPLYKVLECRGYECQSEKRDNVFHVFIRKRSDDRPAAERIDECEAAPFQSILEKFGDKVITMDVSKLEMPQPMINILEALDHIKKGHALLVTHRKFPHLLIPEIETRGYKLISEQAGLEKILLLIYS